MLILTSTALWIMVFVFCEVRSRAYSGGFKNQALGIVVHILAFSCLMASVIWYGQTRYERGYQHASDKAAVEVGKWYEQGLADGLKMKNKNNDDLEKQR